MAKFKFVRKWVEDNSVESPSDSKHLERKRAVGYVPMARWCSREGLNLKQVSKVCLQSHFNGFWYHISPQSGIEEVKGPFRSRTDCKNAYEAYLATAAEIKADVVKNVGYKG